MKASELRIGNLIQSNGYYYRVNRVEEGGIMGSPVKWDNKLIDVPYAPNPIPITEEILLKGGYAANKYHDEFTKGDITLDCEYTDGGVFNALYKDTYIKEIKFLHELQNLEYTLTNTELEINDL
jgi:hypothetical protein